jgi:hypothetical protein
MTLQPQHPCFDEALKIAIVGESPKSPNSSRRALRPRQTLHVGSGVELSIMPAAKQNSSKSRYKIGNRSRQGGRERVFATVSREWTVGTAYIA